MANTTLDVTSLDRPAIRADLISFLRSQAAFQDYDFDGSNLSVLIDLLAYNTNKNAFLTNMLFSEAFIDSAQLMSSVVSHAKELNYTPRSARSSVANVTVNFTATGENQPYIIQKGSSFSTLVKNTQYVFSIPETIVCSSANTSFSFTTPVCEGEYFKDGYTYVPTTDDPHPAFRITNPSVDTTSMTVVIFEDDAIQGDTYNLATSTLDLTDRSQVYFLQATNDGFFEIVFGDGIVGKEPAIGSTVIIDYRVTVGPLADSATRFAINFDPTGLFREASDIAVVTNGSAIGGATPESTNSIKYYAPRWYQTQEKASAAPDYETLLKVQFPEIEAITTYGGEDATPPLYGRVIISVALAGLATLPNSKKTQYEQFLNRRMPLGLRLWWVDPLRTYVDVKTQVRYDVALSALTPNRIESLVTGTITNWNTTYLQDFSTILYYSPFSTAIDKSDASIISNSTTLRLYKKINPTLNVSNDIQLDFQLELLSDLPDLSYPHESGVESCLISSQFTYQGLNVRLEDDSNGNIFIVQDLSGTTSMVAQVGTMNYTSGLISLTLNIDAYPGDAIRLYVRAADADLSSSKNTILEIEPSGIDVKAIPVNR